MVINLFTIIVNELCSGRYTNTLVNESGEGFGALDSLTLTLYDKNTLGILNNRNAQNVLNINQVTLNVSTGELQWDLLPADNAIVTDTLRVEEHRAMFVAKWSGGTKELTHEIAIKVINLRKLP